MSKVKPRRQAAKLARDHRRMTPSVTLPPAPADVARQMDRLADFELQAGRHLAAERLSHQAAQIRGWGA